MTSRPISFLLCCLLMAAGVSAQTAGGRYERLYVFGDSYSDTGAGYLDGNGPTAVAYLAGHLGLRLLPATQRADAQSSLNFAVSGARTGEGQGRRMEGALLGYGMKNQVADFVAGVKGHTIEFAPGRTLFFLAGGLNDSRLNSETTVGNLEDEIRSLYAAGGRRFEVALLPMAVPGFAAVAQRLNPELARIPGTMRKELPGIEITLSDWGLFMDDVMKNAVDYGFQNTTDACAGRAIFHQDATPCLEPTTYYFYHGEHPSTAVHMIVGAKLYEELLTAGPKPE